MRRHVLLDTGPLVAFLNPQDQYHEWAGAHWRNIEPPLLTCEAVLSEACFLAQRSRGDSAAVIELLNRGVVQIAFRLQDELEPIARLLRRYGAVPMSLADACLVRMAENVPDSELFTVDHDFKIYRKSGRQVIPAIMPGM